MNRKKREDKLIRQIPNQKNPNKNDPFNGPLDADVCNQAQGNLIFN